MRQLFGRVLFLAYYFFSVLRFLSELYNFSYWHTHPSIIVYLYSSNPGYTLRTRSLKVTHPLCLWSRKLNRLAVILRIWSYLSLLKASRNSAIVIELWPLDKLSKYSFNLKISFFVTDTPLIIITFKGLCPLFDFTMLTPAALRSLSLSCYIFIGKLLLIYRAGVF